MHYYKPLVSAVKAAQAPVSEVLAGTFVSDVVSAGAKAVTIVSEGIRVKFDGSRARVIPWGHWLVLDGKGVTCLSDDEFRATYGAAAETVPDTANGAAEKPKAKVTA